MPRKKREELHPSVFIGKYVVIDEPAQIGEGTKIWNYTHIRENVTIGKNCTIGDHCYIDRGVNIGDNCKIQNGVSLYYGCEVEDNVFIGPNATFTNVKKPCAERITPPSAYNITIIKKGSTVGANSTIVCGNEIGERALVGAGSIVINDVDPDVTVVANFQRGTVRKAIGWNKKPKKGVR